MENIYNLSFGILAFSLILTLKFTRRNRGFRPTPLDFLILFIALVVSNLPGAQIRSYQMGFLAIKVIVLFFGCEILMGELRGAYKRLGVLVMAALVVIGVSGFIA